MKTTYLSLRQMMLSLVVLSCLAINWPVNPQTPSSQSASTALSSWIALDAPPGWEYLATDRIVRVFPDWQRDSLGNLILRKGSGSPRRVIACGLDRPGFSVTEISDSGYLRLREAGSLRQHPLWTQFHEGQRIRVLTRNGTVPGVVTVKSTHLQRGRNPNAPVSTLDDLWVDVGAAKKSDVQRLGIQLLDPVVRDFPTWTYADYVSGPAAGVRVGCAAVAAAARGTVTSGETIFLLTTLRSFGNDGLEAALRKLGKVDEVTVIDQTAETAAVTSESFVLKKIEKPSYLPESTSLTSANVISPRVKYPRTLVESVKISDAELLLAAIERAASISPAGPAAWIVIPEQTPERMPVDLLSSTASLLKSLADVYAVSGHELNVRERIIAALPAWARQKATTDSEGNLIVEVGPDRDPVMFIAHQDEVGFEITNIASDGTVSLRTRGGLFPSLWEGQTALLHFDRTSPGTLVKAALPGVFVPRENATAKQPEALTAWFGVDGAELKRLGVMPGQSVTSYKSATRLGATRFSARALDDRAGSTALILAAKQIDPSMLKHKLILSWSVREETGLEGAIAMAKRYGSTVKRVFSIDTFVSSDSPAETTRFAYAPLGDGAVIRGLDNSSVAAPTEIDRILAIARAQRIPLQVGATNGGTDGSSFVPYGPAHVGLSWPGRYSHSPVEVLDLRDLQALERLVVALAVSEVR